MLGSVPSTSPTLSPIILPQTLWRNPGSERLHARTHCLAIEILLILGLQLIPYLFPVKPTAIAPFSELLKYFLPLTRKSTLPEFDLGETFFFRAVLSSPQNWMESTEISHILPAHPQPTINIPHRSADTSRSPKVHSFTSGFILSSVHPVGFDKCVMTCIQHFSSIRKSSSVLILLHIACSSLPPCWLLATTDLFDYGFCLFPNVI